MILSGATDPDVPIRSPSLSPLQNCCQLFRYYVLFASSNGQGCMADKGTIGECNCGEGRVVDGRVDGRENTFVVRNNMQ